VSAIDPDFIRDHDIEKVHSHRENWNSIRQISRLGFLLPTASRELLERPAVYTGTSCVRQL
jgi:hypothetical protein